MLGTRPEHPASGTSDRSVTADALLRQEPDEEEDEEEDEDDRKRENEDDYDTTDDGYSESACLAISSAGVSAKRVSSNMLQVVLVWG